MSLNNTMEMFNVSRHHHHHHHRNYWGNETTSPEYHTLPYKVIGTILTGLIFTIGCIGNIMVVMVVLRSKSMRSPTNCYLVSLAFADLLLLLSAAIPTIAEYYLIVDQFVFGALACSIMVFCQYFGFNLSSLSITALTAERYVAICRPMKAQSLCTVGRAKKIIAVLWLFGFCYSAPWLGLATTRVKAGVEDIEQCTFTLDRRQYLAYYMTDLLVMYLTPVVVNAVLYGLIANTLYKSNPITSLGLVGTSTTTTSKSTSSSRSLSQSSKKSHANSCRNAANMKTIEDLNYSKIEEATLCSRKRIRKLRFNSTNLKQNSFHADTADKTQIELQRNPSGKAHLDDFSPDREIKNQVHVKDTHVNARHRVGDEISKDSASTLESKNDFQRATKDSISMSMNLKSQEHLETLTGSLTSQAGQPASDDSIKGKAPSQVFLRGAKNKASQKISCSQPRRGDDTSHDSPSSSSSSSSSPSSEKSPANFSRSNEFYKNSVKIASEMSLGRIDELVTDIEFQEIPTNNNISSIILPATLAILTTPLNRIPPDMPRKKARRLSTSDPSVVTCEEKSKVEEDDDDDDDGDGCGDDDDGGCGLQRNYLSVGGRMNLAASSILSRGKNKVAFSISTSSSTSNHNLSSRIQIIKMLSVVVCLFTILWLPYRLYVVYNSFIEQRFENLWLMLMCRIMILSNSAINPILYNAMSVKFKKAFKKLWSCKRHKMKTHRRDSGRLELRGFKMNSEFKKYPARLNR